MKRLVLLTLLALVGSCRTQRAPSEEDLPITALPKFKPPTEPGPDSVPSEFRYPKRTFDGGVARDAG